MNDKYVVKTDTSTFIMYSLKQICIKALPLLPYEIQTEFRTVYVISSLVSEERLIILDIC